MFFCKICNLRCVVYDRELLPKGILFTVISFLREILMIAGLSSCLYIKMHRETSFCTKQCPIFIREARTTKYRISLVRISCHIDICDIWVFNSIHDIYPISELYEKAHCIDPQQLKIYPYLLHFFLYYWNLHWHRLWIYIQIINWLGHR